MNTNIRKRKKIMDELLYSPAGRAAAATVSTFGSGILCGAVVTDITKDGKLVWAKLHLSGEFWITVLLAVLLLIYYIRMYGKDVVNSAVLEHYQDTDILVAMVRKQHIKELAKWSKQQAKLGNLQQLHSLDQYLRGEYGNGQNPNDGQSTREGSDVS
jgi:hypothetical protein